MMRKNRQGCTRVESGEEGRDGGGGEAEVGDHERDQRGDGEPWDLRWQPGVSSSGVKQPFS